jgi:hypothetical protein
MSAASCLYTPASQYKRGQERHPTPPHPPPEGKSLQAKQTGAQVVTLLLARQKLPENMDSV